jgi:hypothetical protein
MSAIAVLGEYPIELAHALRQIAVRRLDQQVVVIAHQAVRMHHPIERRRHPTQHLQKARAIRIVLIDRLTPIPTRGHVVQRPFELNTNRSSHAAEITPGGGSMRFCWIRSPAHRAHARSWQKVDLSPEFPQASLR